MIPYSEFAPTGFDPKGAFLDDRQDWLVCPCTRTRDSDPFVESNWEAQDKEIPESEDCENHYFNHWGPGWFEIKIVRPGSNAEKIAKTLEIRLEDYPILDDEDFYEREQEEANRVWQDCYDTRERISYIRRYRSQFDFHNLEDMLKCVRGEYFAGYASELIL
jgi:hypothetical protein